MKVTVKYDLQGNPESSKITYQEQVELLKGTLTIKTLEESVERTPVLLPIPRQLKYPPRPFPGCIPLRRQ